MSKEWHLYAVAGELSNIFSGQPRGFPAVGRAGRVESGQGQRQDQQDCPAERGFRLLESREGSVRMSGL